MAFDRFQTYVTFGGSIGTAGTSPEVWQCGLHFAYPTSVLVPGVPTEGQLGDLYDAFAAYLVLTANGIGEGVVLLWAKAAGLDLAGDYTTDPVIYEAGTPAAGITAVGGVPPQVAVAVTLWSGQTLGRANYGRYYLPWVCRSVSPSTGAMSGTANQEMADAAADFIGAANTLAADWSGTDDAVVSNMSAVGAGTTKVVSSVRVGSVKDTQRRRRNRIVEAYATSGV